MSKKYNNMRPKDWITVATIIIITIIFNIFYFNISFNSPKIQKPSTQKPIFTISSEDVIPVFVPMIDDEGNEYLFDGLNNLIRTYTKEDDEYFYNPESNSYVNQSGSTIDTNRLISKDGLYKILNGKIKEIKK